MDLEFSEEQHLMRDMSRAMLAEHCPIEVVRRMEDDPKGYPDGLWKQICELGLAGMLIPEAYGGSAQSLLEAALVYEEFGRALAPTPHFVSCVLSARILLAAGSDEQKGAWVERIAKGEAIVTPRGSSPTAATARPALRSRRAPRAVTSRSPAPSATCSLRARPIG
jgi:alkylation response protein AidB-like acyl-CoA dehydrogenase